MQQLALSGTRKQYGAGTSASCNEGSPAKRRRALTISDIECPVGRHGVGSHAGSPPFKRAGVQRKATRRPRTDVWRKAMEVETVNDTEPQDEDEEDGDGDMFHRMRALAEQTMLFVARSAAAAAAAASADTTTDAQPPFSGNSASVHP